jgi:hypothetical protein
MMLPLGGEVYLQNGEQIVPDGVSKKFSAPNRTGGVIFSKGD